MAVKIPLRIAAGTCTVGPSVISRATPRNTNSEPSVATKAGIRSRPTSNPLKMPHTTVTTTGTSSAGSKPPHSSILIETTAPRAIAPAIDRSMPPLTITSDIPIAATATMADSLAIPPSTEACPNFGWLSDAYNRNPVNSKGSPNLAYSRPARAMRLSGRVRTARVVARLVMTGLAIDGVRSSRVQQAVGGKRSQQNPADC